MDSARLIKFIKWVNALANLNIFTGLSLWISEVILLNLFLLFLFLMFAFDSNLILSTKLKNLLPPVFLSLSLKYSPNI